MTHGRSDAVLEANGKGQTGLDGIAITTPAGPTAIVTIKNAIATPEIHSPVTFTCRAG
jgi:hypothetical protein